MLAIEIKNLNLSYGSTEILKNFNADILAGEFIGIFGPNGAGKSTLLKAILGLIAPKAGAIKIFELGPIGYVPQIITTKYISQMSGKAYVTAGLNGSKWGLPILNKNQQHEVDRVLTLVNAHYYANRPYSKLSGGERQRLLLAQALLNHPKILLLDEPLSSLDPAHQEIFVQLVHKIQVQEKVTILFTAHDLNPLLGLMNKIIYLARGKGAMGSVSEIVTPEKLTWLYGTPMDVIHYQNRLYVINQERGEISDHHTVTGNV